MVGYYDIAAPHKVKPFRGLSSQGDSGTIQLLQQGKPLLIGGVSLLGEKGYIVRTVCFIQSTGLDQDGKIAGLKGWSYFVNDFPGRKFSGLKHFDSSKGEIVELALPNTMTYFVGEIDISLLESSADQKELRAAANYAITFIHD